MAVAAVAQIKRLAAARRKPMGARIQPETFTATELDYALEICNAVTEAWGATPENKVILNLPTTVEMATPNVADQIEWMHRHLARRDSVILSLHPHNDRGTAVAAAELGFDGRRRPRSKAASATVNAPATSISSRWHSTPLRRASIRSSISRTSTASPAPSNTATSSRSTHATPTSVISYLRPSPAPTRTPSRGFAAQRRQSHGQCPTSPIDPADLGRSYDSVIRVNSQSGRGGVAYLLESEYGVVMPRRLQVEFSGVVQRHADAHGGGSTPPTSGRCSRRPTSISARRSAIAHHLYEHGAAQGIGSRSTSTARRTS